MSALNGRDARLIWDTFTVRIYLVVAQRHCTHTHLLSRFDAPSPLFHNLGQTPAVALAVAYLLAVSTERDGFLGFQTWGDSIDKGRSLAKTELRGGAMLLPLCSKNSGSIFLPYWKEAVYIFGSGNYLSM